MEGSITTYNKLRERQLEDHPEWVPSLTDLVYVEHGTGSDRNRVFTLNELFGSNREIELLTDNVSGDTHSLTSADIVEAFKAGRIPVVVVGGGESGTLTRLYYFPKKIYYKDEGYGSNINRDCEFYCFGNDSNGHKVLTWRRYYNIPVQGHGEKYSETVIDLTYPESWQTDELKVGTKWIVKKVETTGDDALAIGYISDNTFVPVMAFKNDGSLVTFGQNAIATDSWKVKETATVLTVMTNEDSPKPFMSFDKTNEYADFKRVYIGSKNVVSISGPTDIGSLSLYSRYPANTILTLFNETSSDKNVTIYGSGQGAEVETIPSHSARQYVKGSSRWYPIYAKDPS
jgi:hypothetical protein